MGFAFFANVKLAGNERKKSSVRAHAHIEAGENLGAPLAHQNSSGGDRLSRIHFYAKIFRI